MAKGTVHLNNANFTAIKHIHAEINEPKQAIANMLIAWALDIINQAKKQGVQDNDIADFIDGFLEHPMTGDHINFMAQNYNESKNK